MMPTGRMKQPGNDAHPCRLLAWALRENIREYKRHIHRGELDVLNHARDILVRIEQRSERSESRKDLPRSGVHTGQSKSSLPAETQDHTDAPTSTPDDHVQTVNSPQGSGS